MSTKAFLEKRIKEKDNEIVRLLEIDRNRVTELENMGKSNKNRLQARLKLSREMRQWKRSIFFKLHNLFLILKEWLLKILKKTK